jgi:hypothetical protein
LALVRWLLANVLTRLARLKGKEMLFLMGLSRVAMLLLYTTMHHYAPLCTTVHHCSPLFTNHSAISGNKKHVMRKNPENGAFTL